MAIFPLESPWFIAQYKPNSGHIAERNLSRQGFVTFLPKERRAKRNRGRISISSRAFFPGYIFVNVPEYAASIRSINSTIGVNKLVSFAGVPSPVPASIIEGLSARFDLAGNMLPPSDLKPGDRVRICSGPFADFFAEVDSVPAEKRVWLLLDLVGQRVRVEARRNQIVK